MALRVPRQGRSVSQAPRLRLLAEYVALSHEFAETSSCRETRKDAGDRAFWFFLYPLSLLAVGNFSARSSFDVSPGRHLTVLELFGSWPASYLPRDLFEYLHIDARNVSRGSSAGEKRENEPQVSSK